MTTQHTLRIINDTALGLCHFWRSVDGRRELSLEEIRVRTQHRTTRRSYGGRCSVHETYFIQVGAVNMFTDGDWGALPRVRRRGMDVDDG